MLQVTYWWEVIGQWLVRIIWISGFVCVCVFLFKDLVSCQCFPHDLRQIMVFGSLKQQIGADQFHWLAWNGKRVQYPKKSDFARFFFSKFPCCTQNDDLNLCIVCISYFVCCFIVGKVAWLSAGFSLLVLPTQPWLTCQAASVSMAVETREQTENEVSGPFWLFVVDRIFRFSNGWNGSLLGLVVSQEGGRLLKNEFGEKRNDTRRWNQH